MRRLARCNFCLRNDAVVSLVTWLAMETLTVELVRFQNAEDLKTMLSADGPCLTVYMPLGRDAAGEKAEKHQDLKLRELLRTVETKAEQLGEKGRELLAAAGHWDGIRDAIGDQMVKDQRAPASMAVFRSENVFQVALIDHPVAERAIIGPSFYIRPVLSELVKGRTFYLLALSEKNTRLLKCTRRSSEEIPLPHSVHVSFEEWMNQTKPDHTAVNNAMTSGSQGQSGPNALAPKGADRERKDEYLAHFFKQIAHGVNEVLKGKTEPLVLCAVEYEVPVYREVNQYPNLVSEEVHGAPNSLKSGEMHARAMEALERSYQQKVDEILAQWNHLVGGAASSRIKEVVTASYEGRVSTLLISDSDEKTGVYDEATHSVKARETGGPADEDIVNEAAVQTILHAGKVLVAPHRKMPNGNAVAAIYRY